MCVVRTLWALPPERRDQAVNATIQNGLEMLLESFSLVQANYPSSGDIHKLWHSLNFPMFYQVDILFTLRVVMELGQLAHPGAQAALNWLREQRQANGCWQGSNPFSGRTVTLEAARILQAA